MKGLMNVLERAGLARKVDDADVSSSTDDQTGISGLTTPAPAEEVVPVEESTSMTLPQIYAAAGVPASPYPAERLLRLLDGLKAMEPAMRLSTIHAIDAADESWTINDPLGDARAKIAAIARHTDVLRAGIAQAEETSRGELASKKQTQDMTVADIRRQITDLEGLLARAIARGEQESAAIEADLKHKRVGASRELENLARAAAELQGLVRDFNVSEPK